MRRCVAVCAVAAAAVLLAAGPASAHVTVDGEGAWQGAADAVLTFRVPNERPDATTVKVAISFPTRTPLASVKPAVKPGWSVTTKKVTFAKPITTDDGSITQGVGEVVFAAASGTKGIPQDAFDTFQVLVGPIPTGVTALAFPTVQTYSNGRVSSWIEPTIAGAEPDHPAPVLTLAPGWQATHGGGWAAGGPSAGPSSGNGAIVVSGQGLAPVSSAASSSEVQTARLLGLIGVGTGALGLVVGGWALGRSRRAAARAAGAPASEGLGAGVGFGAAGSPGPGPSGAGAGSGVAGQRDAGEGVSVG